jgi:hypothetical protein
LSIRTVIVDLESIRTSEIPAKRNSSLEYLANSIVAFRGILRLPIIYQIGVDEYGIISGETEFYAYIKARELDNSLPDSIDALLVDKKNEAEIRTQLLTTESIAPPDSINPVVADTSTLIAIGNLDSKLERFFDIHKKSISTLESTLLTKMESSLPKPLPILVAFNQVNEKSVEDQVLFRLTNIIGKAKAEKFCNQLIAAKSRGETFTSLASLQQSLVTKDKKGKESKLVGAEKMLEIIDKWHQ